MRAITFTEFGGPEVLRDVDLSDPTPGPGQIRVRVHAAGVNPHDSKIRRGWMEQVFPTALPSTPGSELALTSRVVRKPADMPRELAAALPEAGEAATRVLDSLGLRPGETLIVHGAAGAIGTVAVQLAGARGVTVIGTAGPDNQDYVRSLGATPVTYGEGLVDRVRALAPDGVDAAFDVAGKGALEDSIALTGGTERVVTIADMSAADAGVRFDAGTGEGPSVRTVADLVELHRRGGLRLTVARTFALEEAAEAQRISEAGHARGKLVLLVGAPR